MLPYAGYVDPESTLAIGVHHDGHLEATERNFCSLYHTFIFGFHPFAQGPQYRWHHKIGFTFNNKFVKNSVILILYNETGSSSEVFYS